MSGSSALSCRGVSHSAAYSHARSRSTLSRSADCSASVPPHSMLPPPCHHGVLPNSSSRAACARIPATFRSWYGRGGLLLAFVQAKLTLEVPPPTLPASNTVTDAPASARRNATDEPTTPAPTTTQRMR